MHLGIRSSAVVGSLLTLALGMPVAAAAAGTGLRTGPRTGPGEGTIATALTLDGEPGKADTDTALGIDLTQAEDGEPVAAAPVLVERRTDGAWSELTTVTTDEAGHAEVDAPLARDAADNRFRASYAGDGLHEPAETGHVDVDLVRRHGHLRLTGPGRVVDERSATLEVRWTAGDGTPVPGKVTILRKAGRATWRRVDTLRTGEDGRASFTTRPRVDTRWKAKAGRLDWVTGDTSGVHRLDNVPPGEPVKLPRKAPRPRRHLPAQPHAVGAGPHVTIGRVPARVWNKMTGTTYHAGCPVGRASLRYAHVNYWDFQGYRRRGELVANADAVGRITAALAEMYRKELPIRSMYRVDRFGYSRKVHGGNDLGSMAAGNTSVFNCRDVVNRPGVRSPHSYGRAFDLNTWENPYRSARGTVPNTWWQGHSHPRVAWRSRQHVVVKIMKRHGLRWTYGLGDTQHFDAPAGNGRYLPRPAGCDGPCE